jgi:hypothetical protein
MRKAFDTAERSAVTVGLSLEVVVRVNGTP